MRVLLLLVSLSFFLSCTEESINSGEFDRKLEYFPFEKGKTWEYTYDSIVYLNGGSRKDTASGFMKFEIGDSVELREFDWFKSIKKMKNDPYVINRMERISLSNFRLITTDNNLKFINLVFPPNLHTQWDGNIYFNDNIEVTIGGDPYLMFKDWSYFVSTVDTTLQIDGKTYTDVIKVSQVDKENAIERRLSEEYFAKGIGLVLKRQMILNTQNVSSQLTWEQKAQSGMIFTQRILNQ